MRRINTLHFAEYFDTISVNISTILLSLSDNLCWTMPTVSSRGGMRAHGTESGARHTSESNGIVATVGCFNFGATKKLLGVDIFCFEMAS